MVVWVEVGSVGALCLEVHQEGWAGQLRLEEICNSGLETGLVLMCKDPPQHPLLQIVLDQYTEPPTGDANLYLERFSTKVQK